MSSARRPSLVARRPLRLGLVFTPDLSGAGGRVERRAGRRLHTNWMKWARNVDPIRRPSERLNSGESPRAPIDSGEFHSGGAARLLVAPRLAAPRQSGVSASAQFVASRRRSSLARRPRLAHIWRRRLGARQRHLGARVCHCRAAPLSWARARRRSSITGLNMAPIAWLRLLMVALVATRRGMFCAARRLAPSARWPLAEINERRRDSTRGGARPKTERPKHASGARRRRARYFHLSIHYIILRGA